MTSKKVIEQVLTIVGAGCILGVVTWAIVTLINNDKDQETNKTKIIQLQKDVEDLKKINTTLHKMDKTLALQGKDISTMKDDFKDLKRFIENKYTNNIEIRKAKLRTETENNKIASSYGTL